MSVAKPAFAAEVTAGPAVVTAVDPSVDAEPDPSVELGTKTMTVPWVSVPVGAMVVVVGVEPE